MDGAVSVNGDAEITDTLLGMGSVPENGVGESDDIIVAGSEKAKLKMAGGEPPQTSASTLRLSSGMTSGSTPWDSSPVFREA